MSIKSLFEDIADAIRVKSGSSDTYTPAEMPRAILDLPTGSSTADGVSYDNNASGLTANNVQDAIDELAEDMSTINSDLSELETVQFEIDGSDRYVFKQGNVVTVCLMAAQVTNLPTIPAGYRPQRNLRACGMLWNTDSGTFAVCLVDLYTTGEMIVYSNQHTQVSTGNNYVQTLFEYLI